MSSEPVIVHGSFQGSNFGDTLLLMIYARWVRDALDDPTIVASNASAHAARFSRSLHRGRWGALARRARTVFCGGGYLGEPAGDVNYWTMRLYKRHLLFAAAVGHLRVPYHLSGVGVGPLSGRRTRERVVALVEGAAGATVRDEESLRFLHEYGARTSDVRVTADAVFSFAREELLEFARPVRMDEAAKERKGALRVVVHLPGGPGSTRQREEICQAIGKLSTEFDLEVVPATDYVARSEPDFTRWLRAHVPETRLTSFRYESPGSLLELIDAADVVVTSKLHVGICAAVLGRKVVSWATHGKVERMFRQLGRPELTQPLSAVSRDDAVDRLRRSVQADLPVIVPAGIRSSAEENRLQLERFLRA